MAASAELRTGHYAPLQFRSPFGFTDESSSTMVTEQPDGSLVSECTSDKSARNKMEPVESQCTSIHRDRSAGESLRREMEPVESQCTSIHRDRSAGESLGREMEPVESQCTLFHRDRSAGESLGREMEPVESQCTSIHRDRSAHAVFLGREMEPVESQCTSILRDRSAHAVSAPSPAGGQVKMPAFLPGVEPRTLIVLDVNEGDRPQFGPVSEVSLCTGSSSNRSTKKPSWNMHKKYTSESKSRWSNLHLVKESLLPGSESCFCGMFSRRQGLVLFGVFDSFWALSFAFGQYLPTSNTVHRVSEVLLFLLHLMLPISNAFAIRAAYIRDPRHISKILWIPFNQRRLLQVYMWSHFVLWMLVVAFIIVHMSAIAVLDDKIIVGIQKSYSRTNVFVAACADLAWCFGSMLWKFVLAANFLKDQSLVMTDGKHQAAKQRVAKWTDNHTYQHDSVCFSPRWESPDLESCPVETRLPQWGRERSDA